MAVLLKISVNHRTPFWCGYVQEVIAAKHVRHAVWVGVLLSVRHSRGPQVAPPRHKASAQAQPRRTLLQESLSTNVISYSSLPGVSQTSTSSSALVINGSIPTSISAFSFNSSMSTGTPLPS